MLGTVSSPSSAWVVYRSFPGLSVVSFSFLSALSPAFILLLRLGRWTGVDEVPHLLKGWFEVDPFYIDSLLKTFCDASTPDPFVDATLDIGLQSKRNKGGGISEPLMNYVYAFV